MWGGTGRSARLAAAPARKLSRLELDGGATVQAGLSWAIRALAVYAGWVAVTVVGGVLVTRGDKSSLSDLVIHNVGLQFVAACLFLLAAMRLVRWPPLGFMPPQPAGWWKLLWLPALLTAAFVALAVKNGLPSAPAIAFVFINTAMVGFSEETMFRGILFQGFRKAMPIWAAIALSTILFGAVHVLNGFVTGDFVAATVQAIAAGMSGLMYMALVIRTGSIWPSIVMHALWDFSLFLGSGQENTIPQAMPTTLAAWLSHLALALPSFLYALYLLRRIPENAVTQDK